MSFLDPYYQSLEKQREYYIVNNSVDPASRGHIKNAWFNVIATKLKYLQHEFEMLYVVLLTLVGWNIIAFDKSVSW